MHDTSAAELSLPDPGPAARFDEVIADPSTPEKVLQRLGQGDTLRAIAVGWGIPYKRFLVWITSNAEFSAHAMRLRELAAIEIRYDGLEIVDEAAADSDEIALARLRAEYRERLSRDLNKPLFGKTPDVAITLNEYSGRSTESLVQELRGLLARTKREPRVISNENETEPTEEI